MEVRSMTKTGVKASRLGMGVMRMPTIGEEIDESLALPMMDALWEGGVTYYDTAWFYHGQRSEPFVRRALVDRRPRDQFLLATKLPTGSCQSLADCERICDTQMERLGVSYLDFYLLHGIDYKGWKHAQEIGADAFQDKLKKEGRIRYKGFSFHGDNEDLPKMLDENDWDFVQLQLNYADWYLQGADTLYKAAYERKIPIIVMEPVRGGGLIQPHADVDAILRASGQNAAELAFRFLTNMPGVDVVLSGMSTLEQCRENIRIFSETKPFSEGDEQLVRKVVDAFSKLPLIPCTDCRYCKDCPQGINIPQLFGACNDWTRYHRDWGLKGDYLKFTPAERHATACVECGFCESVCPQGIKIMAEIAKAHEKAVSLP